MKHTLKITLVLITVFFIAQVVGLAVTSKYIDFPKTEETGNVTWKPLLEVGEEEVFTRPEMPEKSAFFYIVAVILAGTLLFFLIMRWRKPGLIKFWYFIAIAVCLTIAFNAFINSIIAILLGLFLAGYKVLRPAVLVHNFTEIFVYGGLAAIFVPLLNVFWVSMLLIAISVYDMIAVWKTKHMVRLAKLSMKSKIFAGFLIPYGLPKKTKKKRKGKLKAIKTAVLGGGDVAFPLLFAGVVMKSIGFYKTLVIPVCVTLALFFLFWKGKKERFYPAMPFVSIGCFVGYFIALLL